MSAGALTLRIKLFGRSIESFVRKYRSYLSPRAYKLSQQAGAELIDLKSEGTVSVISIDRSDILIDSGRYFYGFVAGLQSVGHRVYVVKKVWVVTELLKKEHSRSLITGGSVHFVNPEEVQNTDGKGCYHWADTANQWPGAINVRVSRSNHRLDNGLWLPYQAHPANYPLPSECQLGEAYTERGIKVFFSGRVTPSYDSDFVKSHGVLTRNQILEILYDSDLPQCIYDEVGEELDEYSSKVLLPRYDEKQKRSSGSVPKERYLANFKNVSFVICAPGTFMPFAHNVVEAISQGCIPILEYGSYFSPALETGNNCLTFNDPHSLVKAVQKALEMSNDDTIRMREQVISYYHEHLRFSSFIDRVDKAGKQVEAYYIA